PGEVHLALGGRTDDELLHVRVGGLEQAAAFGDGDDRDGVVHHAGGDAGAFHRVDGDVDVPGVLASPTDTFADVEHGRLVAFAFADDDLAVDVELVQDPPHGVDTCLVDEIGVALARYPAGRDGRLFGDAHGVEHQRPLEVQTRAVPRGFARLAGFVRRRGTVA